MRMRKSKDANVMKDVNNRQAGLGATGSSFRVHGRDQVPEERRRAACAVVLVLVAIALCALGWIRPWDDLSSARRSPNVGIGQLEGKTPDEIQAELDRVVEEGMLDLSIAQTMVFPSGEEEGDVRIENVPGNRYLIKVTIALDSTGETVYETGIIEPNHYIERDKLIEDLDKGNYDATAIFTALDPETKQVVGDAAVKVSIMVES